MQFPIELKYKCLEQLKHSQFKNVYLCEKEDKSLVAVKVVDAAANEHSGIFERDWEFSQLLKGKSPFLLRVFQKTELLDSKILEMEYGNCRSLSVCRYSRSTYTKILFQLLNGFRVIHESGLIHGNIKPSNIVVCKTNIKISGNKIDQYLFKICDFSYACNVGDVAVNGTPLHMPPEMLDKKPYDQKRDVWACGLILYQLVVGSHPFQEAQDIFDLKEKIAVFNVRQDAALPADVDSDCQDLLSQMLLLNPTDRISVEVALKHPFFTRDKNWLENEVVPLPHSPSLHGVAALFEPLLVSAAYEVSNGFSGMNRIVILHLLHVVGFEKHKVRVILGISSNFLVWRSHSYFAEGRKQITAALYRWMPLYNK